MKRKKKVQYEATAGNERFAKIAALSRIKGSGILEVHSPLEVNRLPQLRQAATTLAAMRGRQCKGIDCKPMIAVVLKKQNECKTVLIP